MWFQIKSYFFFLLKSTNKHGVHSPFVFNLVTKCFNQKTTKEKLNQFLLYKKSLLTQKEMIKVTDFGAGSQVFKSNLRAVSKISKVAGISTKKASILIRCVAYFKPDAILEIGTSLGMGTYALSLGNPKANIISLEGCPETAKIAANQLKKFNINSVKIKIGDFKDTLPRITQKNTFDIIYFDGNHQQKPTLHYFEWCLQSANNDSIFIFDDIHWNDEMEKTWKQIKNHPKVTVTIDIFYMGFVFFRKEQQKEHFNIRV